VWDAIAILAVLGVAYGTWQMIASYGGWRGVILSFASLVLGWIAAKVLYPLWFGD